MGVALLEGRASSEVEYRTKPPRARRRTERTWWPPRIVWPCSLVPEGTEWVAQTVRWGEDAMVSSAFRADGEASGHPSSCVIVLFVASCGISFKSVEPRRPFRRAAPNYLDRRLVLQRRLAPIGY